MVLCDGAAGLEKTATGWTVAAAGKFAVMVGFFVVEGQFGAGFNRAQGIKFRAFANNAHESIRRTGMVDEPESASGLGSINGFVVVHLDNGNVLLIFGSSPAFSSADKFSLIFSQFLSSPERDFGV